MASKKTDLASPKAFGAATLTRSGPDDYRSRKSRDTINAVTCLYCHSTEHARHFFEPCKSCGSTSRVRSAISVAGLQILPSLNVKAKNPSYRGRHNYIRDTKFSTENSVDGEFVRVNQLIDRGNNRYR